MQMKVFFVSQSGEGAHTGLVAALQGLRVFAALLRIRSTGIDEEGMTRRATGNIAILRQPLECGDETRRSRGDLAAFAGGTIVPT